MISHCTIDTIEINDSKYVVPGGPGCYCSLTAKALKFDVKLHTKFGSDFTHADYLSKQKIMFENALSCDPTRLGSNSMGGLTSISFTPLR